MRHHSSNFTVAAVLIAMCGLASAAQGQEKAPGDRKPANVDSQEAERREILESDEWRQVNRAFNEWLSVQQIYRPEEVAAIKAGMKERVAHMSPRELRDFLDDMRDRLHVLLSPEAEDARHWLQQFFAVARNPEELLGRSRPDVLNMTASQIRQEILWLEQHRASRAQAQAAFDRTREMQLQMNRDAQAARQTARMPVQSRSDWPANNPRTRSPYAPRREREPLRPNPVYMIGPWGAPYFRF